MSFVVLDLRCVVCEQYTDDERIILECDLVLLTGLLYGTLMKVRCYLATLIQTGHEHIIRPTKLKLQLDYVHHHNLWIDIKLIVHAVANGKAQLLSKRVKWIP